MLYQLKLVFIKFDDFAYFFTANVFQSISLDELVEGLLVFANEKIGGDCCANGIT